MAPIRAAGVGAYALPLWAQLLDIEETGRDLAKAHEAENP